MSLPFATKFRRRWFPARAAGDWKIPEDRECFDVFLLLGQSNMAGYGCIAASDPWQEGDLEPVPRVLMLGGQGTLASAVGKGRAIWQPAAHPLHLNQKSGGFGLAPEFARHLLATTEDRSIGLVPCAWGGAAISKMAEGTALYRNSLKRARLAAKRGRIRAVLWHQGESDADNDELASAHATELRKLMAAWRHDLGLPSLPFLIGDLAPFLEQKLREKNSAAAGRIAVIRAGLRELAASDPHASFVESEGLKGVDTYHFGRHSLKELARRYALEWLA